MPQVSLQEGCLSVAVWMRKRRYLSFDGIKDGDNPAAERIAPQLLETWLILILQLVDNFAYLVIIVFTQQLCMVRGSPSTNDRKSYCFSRTLSLQFRRVREAGSQQGLQRGLCLITLQRSSEAYNVFMSQIV